MEHFRQSVSAACRLMYHVGVCELLGYCLYFFTPDPMFIPNAAFYISSLTVLNYIVGNKYSIGKFEFLLCLRIVFFLLMVFLAEVVVDEIFAIVYRWRSPRESPWPVSYSYWTKIRHMRSSNSGYSDSQFIPVVGFGFNSLDDPFFPDHRSTVYMVEVRRRSFAWRSIVVWQVSILNGGQKKVHQFEQFCGWSNGRIFQRRYPVSHRSIRAYFSNGVIFISFRDVNDSLYVYDTRYGKATTYKHPTGFEYETSIAIQCLDRLISTNGTVEGWRIRMITGYIFWDSEEFVYRTCLTNCVFELRETVRLASKDEFLFGRFHEPPRRLNRSCGPDGFVIVNAGDRYGYPIDDGPWMLYNWTTDEFSCLSDRQTLYRCFYMTNRSCCGGLLATIPGKECVIFQCKRGLVRRRQFAVPTLKYLATRQLFRDNPELRKMTVEQFRQATGIDGMDGHLGYV